MLYLEAFPSASLATKLVALPSLLSILISVACLAEPCGSDLSYQCATLEMSLKLELIINAKLRGNSLLKLQLRES